MTAASDTRYKMEELDDPAFVRSELAWYRDVFERMRDRDLAELEAQHRAADPKAAQAYYGAPPTVSSQHESWDGTS